MSIVRFRHKGLKALFVQGDSSGIRSDLVKKTGRVLAALDRAATMDEMESIPGWRLHPLKGELKGLWSVSVSGNWRIIFRFEDGDASDVDLVDYH